MSDVADKVAKLEQGIKVVGEVIAIVSNELIELEREAMRITTEIKLHAMKWTDGFGGWKTLAARRQHIYLTKKLARIDAKIDKLL